VAVGDNPDLASGQGLAVLDKKLPPILMRYVFVIAVIVAVACGVSFWQAIISFILKYV